VYTRPPLRTLLLAESHPPTLEHLTGLLSQAGYTVRAVSDPGSAMEHFIADNPDMVVVSVDLPRLDGAHVGNLIRKHSQGARVPIVAIDKGHLGRARGVTSVLDLKVNAYVVDPLKPGELVGRLQSLVEAAARHEAPLKGVRAMLARPAVVSGDLKGFPLPALLVSLYRQQRDGVLVVAYRDLTRRVFFARGGAVNYDSSARQDALPSYLLQRQVVTEAQAERVVQALGSGLRIGAALAEAGVEAAGEELLQLLREYTSDRLAQVVGMREGRYAFYLGDEFQAEVATVETPALEPILDGARRAIPLKVMAAPLRSHQAEFPVRTPEFGKDLEALGLNTDDLKIAMQINGRIALRDLLAHGRGDLRSGYSLLWFLKLTGCVGFSPTPLSPGPGESAAVPDVIAPRKRKPLPPETETALREGAVKIITGSYFRCLGLDIAADTEAVERAYQELAMRFHSDSYAEYDTSEMMDLLESVQDKLSAAYRVLSVEEKRKAYLQYLMSRMDVGRSTTVNVDAEIILRRGEAALKRKQYRSALIHFEEAVTLNPQEPEYYSYLAWATFLAGTGPREDRAKAAQKVLRKALSLNPYLERALIISAIIDSEMEDASGARKKLLKVLELNPNSQLAKAALRKVGR
jgi:DNA-binding response OmpR family regulator/Flp pilus assembly protein TadD